MFLYMIIEKVIEEYYFKLFEFLFNIEIELYLIVYVLLCMLRYVKGFKVSRLVS